MKKIAHILSASLLLVGIFAHAEVTKVECSTNPEFAKNTCGACYTETFDAKESNGGWTSTITDFVIPWEHGTGDLDEIIYDTDQKLPEVKSSLTVTLKPTEPKDLWKNAETLIWKPFDDHKEFVIKKGEKVGLYRIAQDASITVQGKTPKDTVLFNTPLSVGNFNAETNEETEPKVRNICVLGSFMVKKGDTTTPDVAPETGITPETVTSTPEETTTPPDVAPEAVDTAAAIEGSMTEEVPKELNSAGPEQPVVVAKPEQTETKSGPEIWIFLALSIAFASGWHAWKKQQS